MMDTCCIPHVGQASFLSFVIFSLYASIYQQYSDNIALTLLGGKGKENPTNWKIPLQKLVGEPLPI